MLLFRDEEAVQMWCNQSAEPYGDVVPFQQVWELSKLWYGNRGSPDYRGRTMTEAQAVFAQVGLLSDFWAFS